MTNTGEVPFRNGIDVSFPMDRVAFSRATIRVTGIDGKTTAGNRELFKMWQLAACMLCALSRLNPENEALRFGAECAALQETGIALLSSVFTEPEDGQAQLPRHSLEEWGQIIRIADTPCSKFLNEK